MLGDVARRIIDEEKDLSQYPDIHLYVGLKLQALWVLEIAGKEYNVDRLTANQIAEILVDKFEVSATPQAVGSALGKAANEGLVNKRTASNEFKIMKKGRKELYLTTKKNPTVFYIEPDKPYSAKLILFEGILSGLKNRVWICDPYVGIRLLDILNKMDASIEIRIMTQQVENRSGFIRGLADFRKEHPNTEVRTTSAKIHDRYILSDTGMWLVGHSLKGVGSKESFIVPLGDDIRDSVEAGFRNKWSNSTRLT